MWRKIRSFVPLLPALITLIVLFWFGLIFGFLESIGLFSLSQNSKFTLEHYITLFKSDFFTKSLFLSFYIAIVTTMLNYFISTFLLYSFFKLKNSYKLSSFLEKILLIPLLFPYLVAAYMCYLLLAQTGLLSSLLLTFGYINDFQSFPIWTNDKGAIGIIITYTWKTIPFVILMTLPILKKVMKKWEKIGVIMGARGFKYFIYVVYPLCRPMLFSSLYIVFAYTFSSFEVPYYLGVTYPKTLAVLAYDIYANGSLTSRPQAMVVNIVILAILALVALIIQLRYRRKRL